MVYDSILYNPRGSTHTTIRELGPIIPSRVWYLWPNSLILVYMDPLGIYVLRILWAPQLRTKALEAGLNVEMPGIEPRYFGGYLLDKACYWGAEIGSLLVE